MAAQLADSFHKVGRSVRQFLALDAKLARDHAAEAREASTEDERVRPARVARRKAEVCQAVERLIWEELESSEGLADEAEDEITVDFVCDEVMLGITDEEFAETSVPDLIARLKPRIAPELRKALAESAGRGAEEPPLQNTG